MKVARSLPALWSGLCQESALCHASNCVKFRKATRSKMQRQNRDHWLALMSPCTAEQNDSAINSRFFLQLKVATLISIWSQIKSFCTSRVTPSEVTQSPWPEDNTQERTVQLVVHTGGTEINLQKMKERFEHPHEKLFQICSPVVFNPQIISMVSIRLHKENTDLMFKNLMVHLTTSVMGSLTITQPSNCRNRNNYIVFIVS